MWTVEGGVELVGVGVARLGSFAELVWLVSLFNNEIADGLSNGEVLTVVEILERLKKRR